jgi:hypothetical protein
MDPKYLKISTIDKDIYFHITDIKKYHQYSAHGIDFHNYHVMMKEQNHLKKNMVDYFFILMKI